MATEETNTCKTSEIGDTGAAIQIEHLANKAAIIHVIYPDDRRRRDVKILKIICAALCLVPAIAWFIFRGGSAGGFAVIVSALVAIYVMVCMIRKFSAISRSYVFRADHTGLTIETSSGRHQTIRHFARARIADIRLGFSNYRGRNSLFHCWLVIQTGVVSGNIRCLHDLGGDHLARIADVLHAALGMPARSWP